MIAGVLSILGALMHGGVAEMLLLRRVVHKNVVRYRPVEHARKMTALAKKMGADESAQIWRYLNAGWHFLTVNFVVAGVVLLRGAYHVPEHYDLLAKFIAVLFAGHMFVWLGFVALPRKLNILRAPQWLLVGAIAVFAWLGSYG